MGSQIHLAHITKINGQRVEQTMKDHSFQTAEYAAECLEPVGLGNAGYLAGLLHDCGKCKEEWSAYIEAVNENRSPPKGSVNHTFAAVRFLMETYYDRETDMYRKLACEILSVAAGSHHGLFDLEDPSGMKKENGITHRIAGSDTDIGYSEATENFFKEITDRKSIDEYYSKAVEEIVFFVKRMEAHISEYKKSGIYFMFGFLTRLISSAIIEGDRRDTAEFMNGRKTETVKADKEFWGTQREYMEAQLKLFTEETPINCIRTDISNQCRLAAEKEGGIYRLNVATGGGKTLASLRYAFAHAEKHKKKRIFYIIPLLSILDQNSKEIHRYMKDDQYILEHHSDIIRTHEDNEEWDEREMLLENWDAPVIITTMVQLLNVLFSDKTSAVRRMKSLCGSIVIIDEIQSLPMKFGELFNMAMNFLADCCGTTVILCSATQPAFEELEWPLHLAEPADIIRKRSSYEEVFRRTEAVNRITDEGMTLEQLSEFAEEVIREVDSLLIICNTKKTAKNLFRKLDLIKQENWEIYHLSTSMCKKHREQVLKKIGKTPGLNEDRKVICVSTQLVEAGIDFSFESVIRIRAGIDSLVQAAGRCNRSNEWKKICPVYIVKLQKEELGSLEYIKKAQDTLESVLYEMKKEGSEDFLSDEFIGKYFRRLYATEYRKKETRFGVMVNGQDLSVRDMLSMNRNRNCEEHYILGQAFKTAGKNCNVFDDEKSEVIVPYDEKAKECILNMISGREKYDIGYLKTQLEQLKLYTVELFPSELNKLREDGMLDETGFPGAVIVSEQAYSMEIGICTDKYGSLDDVMIF